MRALALYNTRGMVAPLELLRKRHLEHCDIFIHCGNSMVDYTNEFISGYITIRGNDDFEQHYLRDYILTIEEQKILIMNNIEYRGQDGPRRLAEFVTSLDDTMSIVICATRVAPYSELLNNVLYVCPGDASERLVNSYAIIETEDDGIRVSFFDITSGALKNTVLYPIEKR
ncbi:phosphoesterase [Erysipelotrichaceae bacterium]|nr:phosphoesterase [Erysipelotrichaceae bacterium]